MNLMSWQFVLFTKITALKTSVKSVTVVFIVSYLITLWNMSVFEKEKPCIFVGYHVLYRLYMYVFLRYQTGLKSLFFRFGVQLNFWTPPYPHPCHIFPGAPPLGMCHQNLQILTKF